MSHPGTIRESLELTAGDVLADRYVIEGELGIGGMGTVYRALDRHTGATVAIKGLNRPGPDLLMHFKREYRELADVHHPNLVRLGELFEAGGRVYFSMELVDGVDFMSWVRPGPSRLRPDGRRGPGFDEGRLRTALRQLASGLVALHAAHQVHRDIKPENVLVDRAGRVVILDFGLSARLVDGRQHGEVLAVGTAAYMAPEQAMGEAVGPRADWYSVGVLLYEALTGELPFDGDTVALLTAKLTEDAPDPARLVLALPADLVALTRELLARAPTSRPSGAHVMRLLASGDRTDGEVRLPVAAPVAFVGRRRELDALAEALSEARRGPVIQLVLGESGLGKTALVQAFLEPLARRDELLVLSGRCHEREALPFKAFDAIADALSRALVRWPAAELEAVMPPRREMLGALFPALDQVPPIGRAAPDAGAHALELDFREVRRRAFGAFRELLQQLAGRRRLILFIDDLHRADPDSVDLLRDVMAPGDGPAPLLIGTARPSAVIDALVLMGAGGELVMPRLLRLEALDEGPACELARLALARSAGPSARIDAAPVAAIAAESQGHPGFILELTRATVEAARHTGSLDDVIMARVDRLPPEQRAILDVIAVAEAPVVLAVLAAAVAREPGRLLPAIDALREVELIAISGRGSADWVEPYHDHVADAVRDGLTDAARAAAHAALARALDAAGDADPERVLSHYLAAGDPGPVLRLATIAAGRAADAMEHRRAARLCRLALAHGPSSAEADALHRAAAESLAALGAGIEAAEHYLEAAALAAARGDADGVRDARRRAADQLLLSGEVRRGVAVLDDVLRELGLGVARSTPAALARLAWSRTRLRLRRHRLTPRTAPIADRDRARLEACWSASLGLAIVDTMRGAEYHARFLRLALASGDRGLAARGLAIEAAYVAAGGSRGATEARALLDQAERLCSTEADRGWVDLGRGMALHMLGDFTAAMAAADRAVEAFVGRAGAGAWEQRNARLYAIRARWWSGRLDELAAMVRDGVADARRHGDHYSLVQMLVGVGGHAWLMADDVDGFWANVDEATALWSAPTYQLPDYYRLTSVVRGHCYAGDGAEAWHHVEAVWQALARSSVLRMEFMAVDAHFVRGSAAVAAAATTAGPARARLHAEVDRCAARLAGFRPATAQGFAAALRAAVRLQRGDRVSARAGLDDASAHFARAGMPVFAAATRWHAAALRGDDEGAATQAGIAATATAMGVVAPARFAAMLVPGLSP